jgi:serine/threonine-protein kinase
MNRWIWIGKFLIVIVAAISLGEILGGLSLFQRATLGTPDVNAGSVVRFVAHAGALMLVWLFGQRLAGQLGALRGDIARLADSVLAIITLIVTVSAYFVLMDFGAPLLGNRMRGIVDWLFILGILAAAAWLLWSLYRNAESVIAAIGRATRQERCDDVSDPDQARV